MQSLGGMGGEGSKSPGEEGVAGRCLKPLKGPPRRSSWSQVRWGGALGRSRQGNEVRGEGQHACLWWGEGRPRVWGGVPKHPQPQSPRSQEPQGKNGKLVRCKKQGD